MSNKRIRTTVTGFSHPRCYAAADNNCSTKISSEHFISRNLLDRIDAVTGRSLVAGRAWQEPQTLNRVPTSGLAANILCEAHNSRLSDLDALVGKFADDVRDTDRGQFVQGSRFSTSGSRRERWMLKLLFGAAFSGNVTSQPKPECLDLLLTRAAWPDGWGLYFGLGRPVHHTDSIEIETLVGPDKRLLAARIFIQGLPFTLILGKPDNPA